MKARQKTDVLVVGGGPAGIGAAIAAGRTGARTLLVDRFPFLGGEANTGLLLHAFHNNREDHIVHGIGWEIIERLKKMGCAAELRHRDPASPAGPSAPRKKARSVSIDREAFKYVVLTMLEEAGVDVLLHSFASDVVMEGNAIRGVVVQNKSGRVLLPAEVVVDATGDADVAALAGAPFEKGRQSDGVMQPLSMMFTIGNVDIERAVDSFGGPRGDTIDPLPGQPRYMQFILPLDRWLDDLRRELPDVAPFAHFQGSAFRPGIVTGTTSTHIANIDATDAEQLSQAEIQGHKIAYRLVGFLRRNVPGFEDAYLLSTAPHVGVRETRRILGEYYLTLEDVLEARQFEDVVALGAWYVDIHDYKGGSEGHKPKVGYTIKDDGSYDIPYRCLVPQKVESLLVAGRCLSASHEAQAAARVMGTCLAMGHAVGTAAALAVQEGVTPRQVQVRRLQETLLQQGAYLGERLKPVPVPLAVPRPAW